MVIETFAEPLERTYDEEDLLTKIYHINPNWKPGDPDDYRYITSYVNEGYTGFLPVHLKIDPPNFVHQWGIEQSNGLIEWKSLPILEDGKYKFYYNNGQEGPFGLGFVPVKRYNQNIEDYDFSINVLKPNIATLKITDGVLDSILTMEGGTLNLPSTLQALNEATAFNTNGKDYATGVSIDLSELTYYPTMPMPQFNNGNGSNIIDITENNSTTTFEELDSNRKTIEYITTPENPTPTPLMRSIVANKSNNETKGKTRDATTSNIVGYINVNIPPPSISSTIKNNGYYKFNTGWNGLIQGTELDYELDINVKPLLQNKTVTIDSIESNQSTVITKTGDYVSLIPPLASNTYNGGEIEVDGTLGTNTYKLFDGNTSTNIDTDNITINIKFDHLVTVNKIWIQVGDSGSWTTSSKYRLYGCNDDQYEDLVILYESNQVGSYTKLEQVINENNTKFKYYRIIINNGQGRGSVTREIRLYTYQSTFDGINTVTIVNNTDSKIYKGYNNNNKYSITQTGDGTITIPTDYQALGEIKYNVNVPTTLVDNADVDSQNNNVISTNGTFTIPSGKTGWNSFSVNVPQPQQTKINFKYVKYGEQTLSLSSFSIQQSYINYSLPPKKTIFSISKSNSIWELRLLANSNAVNSRSFSIYSGNYYYIFDTYGGSGSSVYLCDDNLNNICSFLDNRSEDEYTVYFYLYEDYFNFIFD